MKRIILILVGLLGCQEVALLQIPTTEQCALPFDEADPGAPLREFLRYNFVQQKSSHNSYDKELSLTEQLELGIRSIELDIHITKGQQDALADDWYVFHIDAPFLRSTNCETLSLCLQELQAFHEANPNHEVITVWVDLKDDFNTGHSPEALDAVLTESIESIFTPEQLLSSCDGATTLRDAVRGGCRWPTLGR
jgi:hypothetical protein